MFFRYAVSKFFYRHWIRIEYITSSLHFGSNIELFFQLWPHNICLTLRIYVYQPVLVVAKWATMAPAPCESNGFVRMIIWLWNVHWEKVVCLNDEQHPVRIEAYFGVCEKRGRWRKFCTCVTITRYYIRLSIPSVMCVHFRATEFVACQVRIRTAWKLDSMRACSAAWNEFGRYVEHRDGTGRFSIKSLFE